MPVIDQIAANADEITSLRRDFHEHPEIGFQETRTSGIVADRLRHWGVDEVHVEQGGTGVVGLIRGKHDSTRRVGLRADMDALPIHETTNLPFASKNPGVMHACGHDAHTAMLLGAAKYLAETRDFAGTAVLIFQPAEEGLGGARRMIEEGLFDKFSCDEIYSIHNDPMSPMGQVNVTPGPAMAGASFFDITVTGTGSHAAMPQDARDALVAASALVGALQTIVSRNTAPLKALVLSVTQIHAGAAYNVVPETATLAGTIRYFDDDVAEMAHRRMREICDGFAAMHGIEVNLKVRKVFDVMVNDPARSADYIDAAREIVGADASISDKRATGSEDFADMLRVVPGAYCTIGHGSGVPVHNPAFTLDEAVLPLGASVMARIVERRLAAG